MPCPFDDASAGGCDTVGHPADGGVCPGVGHASCVGGSLPLNAFGEDLKAAGFAWTEALCRKDSDGDGVTNGEELGDPCCAWISDGSNGPLPFIQGLTLGHPGFASSVGNFLVGPKAAGFRCSNGAAAVDAATAATPLPTRPFNATTWDPFHPGETGFVKRLRIASFSIPRARTTYYNFYWDFPECADGKCHVVGMSAFLDNNKYLHHYVLKGCEGDVRTMRGQNGKNGTGLGSFSSSSSSKRRGGLSAPQSFYFYFFICF